MTNFHQHRRGYVLVCENIFEVFPPTISTKMHQITPNLVGPKVKNVVTSCVGMCHFTRGMVQQIGGNVAQYFE